MTAGRIERHPRPANLALRAEVEDLLYEEARLLDAEDLDEWLGLIAADDPDFDYWMPVIESRYRQDPLPPYERGDTALLEFTAKEELVAHSRALVDPSSPAGNPAPHHVRVISNIQVAHTEHARDLRVHSVVAYHCTRHDENFTLWARREDLVRRGDDQTLRIVRRTILPGHTVIPTGAIRTLF
ncbi:aromatic-ring-hydroxylating dioxygenase subunit beta [Streptomyces coffeae]|uniref:Aromatic-ring-hydroxylating dioxygenase subunit beta n=1 Tax=Streptomyces coffeae TaxID=621382 RepID=A0ABS1NLM5_9ACTN|nr:aromatic-ring-hydroxylating dioxygenase subunit beta [Streptomyces coffeae]MBL1101000.1 hypothetical protein [Streptomyces coffeae]